MRGSFLRSAVLLGTLAFGGAVFTPPAAAVSWNNYTLGDFYDISQATDAPVRNAGQAVVFFGNATGFVISPEGHVLTNYHVYQSFGNGGTVYVQYTAAGYARTLQLSLVVANPNYDVALYKANVTNLPYLKIDSSAPYVNEDVFIVGHPNSRSQEVSFGKILATGHNISGRPSIEYSAQTWWGSSGSPVCNRSGSVIGIHWGWDQYGTSTGRLAGIPFNLICAAIPEIARVAQVYGVGATGGTTGGGTTGSTSGGTTGATTGSTTGATTGGTSGPGTYTGYAGIPGLGAGHRLGHVRTGTSTGGSSTGGSTTGGSTTGASSTTGGSTGSSTGNGYRDLPLGGSVNGNLAAAGALAYFRCTVPARGDLTIDLRGPAGADFDLAVFKWDTGTNRGTNVGTGDGQTSTERVTVTNASPGTYVVVVQAYSGSGNFTLSSALQQQTAVGTGSSAATDVLAGTGDWKLYQVNATASGTVSVILDGPAGTDFDVYVFRGLQVDANAVVASGESYTSHEAVTFTVSAGSYSILVRSAGGAGRFDLKVQ